MSDARNTDGAKTETQLCLLLRSVTLVVFFFVCCCNEVSMVAVGARKVPDAASGLSSRFARRDVASIVRYLWTYSRTKML